MNTDTPPTSASTAHSTDDVAREVKRALRDLIALERDRCLGYAYEDLHMPAEEAIEAGLAALDQLGSDPDTVVLPDDQEKLDLNWERPPKER